MYVATEKSNKANDAAQDKANIERHKALDTALAQIERQFGKRRSNEDVRATEHSH